MKIKCIEANGRNSWKSVRAKPTRLCASLRATDELLAHRIVLQFGCCSTRTVAKLMFKAAPVREIRKTIFAGFILSGLKMP